MSVVVRVENVSKKYHLGKIGTATLKGDFHRWWARQRGKEDPFAVIGDQPSKSQDVFWALRDVNFDIRQGEAVGIIGKNGAGKSTLLKILSRITLPTSGSVKVRGRIASLLEVGTGFNPDLSGRENVYLNGAILGMTKQEVKRKFDEIIDFSGVEKFIDTPVKRYSSGMYVRLAFAVAAHLDSEILILDEVLAVGDADFQQKCLKKMDEVTHTEGRTVIFVSHDINSVRKLCEDVIYLVNGKVSLLGKVSEVTEEYQLTTSADTGTLRNEQDVLDGEAKFTDWRMYSPSTSQSYSCYSKDLCEFTFTCVSRRQVEGAQVGMVIKNLNGDLLITANSFDSCNKEMFLERGKYDFTFRTNVPLKAGHYQVEIAIIDGNNVLVDHWVTNDKFTVSSNFKSVLSENWLGLISTDVSFTCKSVNKSFA